MPTFSVSDCDISFRTVALLSVQQYVRIGQFYKNWNEDWESNGQPKERIDEVFTALGKLVS